MAQLAAVDDLEAEPDRGPAPPLDAAAYFQPRGRLQTVVVDQVAVILVHGQVAAVAILAAGHETEPSISWSPWWWRGPIRAPVAPPPTSPIPPPHPGLRATPAPAPMGKRRGWPPLVSLPIVVDDSGHKCTRCGVIGHGAWRCPGGRSHPAPAPLLPFPWIA
jgi:hypothetical protein